MISEDIKNTNDSELLMLFYDNDETAKNILYLKYKFIIDILIKKYKTAIHTLKIDEQEVYSEAAVGFSDALNNYKENKNTSLGTFITLVVERRIKVLLRKYNQEKYKSLKESLSLDNPLDNEGHTYVDLLVDESIEPLKNLTESEDYNLLIHKIKNSLSKVEYEIFELLIRDFGWKDISEILNLEPKQVDNGRERIKRKIRKLLENETD